MTRSPREGMYSQPESLIFDFDGVLADTEPLYWRAWEKLLAPHGVELCWEEYCRIGRGVKDDEMLMRLPQIASDAALLSRLKEQLAGRKETIQSWCSQEPLISAATVILLQSLSTFRLGLVTSSNRSEVEPVLNAAGVAACFQAMVFGDEVSLHKPHPAPYLLIREKLGVATGLVFEDTDVGMESATAAGFEVVRVDAPANLVNIVQQALTRH
jgi:HAD superfamily hydrolase (TIGR01509 family)